MIAVLSTVSAQGGAAGTFCFNSNLAYDFPTAKVDCTADLVTCEAVASGSVVCAYSSDCLSITCIPTVTITVTGDSYVGVLLKLSVSGTATFTLGLCKSPFTVTGTGKIAATGSGSLFPTRTDTNTITLAAASVQNPVTVISLLELPDPSAPAGIATLGVGILQFGSNSGGNIVLQLEIVLSPATVLAKFFPNDLVIYTMPVQTFSIAKVNAMCTPVGPPGPPPGPPGPPPGPPGPPPPAPNPAPAAPPTSDGSSRHAECLTVGPIIGVVFGSLIGTVLIIVLAILLLRRLSGKKYTLSILAPNDADDADELKKY